MVRNAHNFAKIQGITIVLREAEVRDSAFILQLRTDEKKSRFLHKQENDLQKQIKYMENYKQKLNEWYFVIEDKEGNPLGVNSIYPTYNAFALRNNLAFYEIGRWIMRDGVSFLQVLESDFLTKRAFYEIFKCDDRHVFTLYPQNREVLNFHLKFGAKRVGMCEEEGLEVLLFTKESYEESKGVVLSLLNRL